MRKGQNPAKFVKDVARPERITAALLNYIPFLSGFYAETLDVLKVCLDSLRRDAGLPFDLLVFDNGSCAEVRDFLLKEKEEGRIQYLILSERNMGKGDVPCARHSARMGRAAAKAIRVTADCSCRFTPP